MEKIIESLTSEQAQKAVVSFYRLIPALSWENQSKPSEIRIETLVEEAQSQAPPEMEPFFKNVLSNKNPDYQGEIAKYILQGFFESEKCRPYVRQAMEEAREPHMEPITIMIGVFLIIMALMSTQIDKSVTTETTTKNGVAVQRTERRTKFSGRAPEMLKELTKFVEKLPLNLKIS